MASCGVAQYEQDQKHECKNDTSDVNVAGDLTRR